MIRDWSEIAYAAALEYDKYAVPHFDDRVFSLVAIAQHDAVNSVSPHFETYAYADQQPGGDPVAAAAQAARDVLAASYPKQVATFDQKLAGWLGKIAEGEAKQKGITAGSAAAAAVLAKRASDGFDKVVAFAPVKKIGAYTYVPPFDGFAYDPQVGSMTPFVLTSPEQFRPTPPPALTSDTYTTDFDEVKAVGSKTSTTRTAEESAYGQFWYEYSIEGWTRIARVVSAEKQSDLWETARLFAVLDMAMWDGWIAGFNAKYFYAAAGAGWRPYTAIRMAKSDGNPKTAPDAKWEPFLATPPVPDYPSTHAVLGATAAAVLAATYGDATAFTFTAGPSNLPSPPANLTRSFTSFSQAASENSESRIKIGIHFRYACNAGLAMGKSIGELVASTALKKK